MGYEINRDKALEWINKWRDSFDTVSVDLNSLKTLIFLALLERREETSSYQDIADELKRRGAVSGDLDVVPLRNGMNQIVKALQTHSLFEIENRKNGRAASYRLRPRGQAAAKSNGAGGAPRPGSVVKILDDPELTASTGLKYVAEKLMIDRVMPFHGIYLPMTAASRWVLYSEGEAGGRGKYEADECVRLLGDWLHGYRGKEMSVIGLGVGEGIGEIEIIERLLDRENKEGYDFSRIHYCAVDTNVHLLMSHIERLRHRFEEEIETGRLVCAVVCGNFLQDFSGVVGRARAEFARGGPLADSGRGFLPDDGGTLVSILGNVVGNAEKAKEWSYFEPVLNELKGYDLAFLLGVSVLQGEKVKEEKYDEQLENLLLATPRFLTHDLSMLKTGRPAESAEPPEFMLPEGEEKRQRWPGAMRAKYEGAGIKLMEGAQVTGDIYEFYYITRWDLSMKVDDGKVLSVREGSPLLLYNIIKFNKETLIKFLESKGLYPSRQKTKTDAITSGNENRTYAIIAMMSSEPE